MPRASPTNGSINRAAHFAGGRLKAQLDRLPDNYSVELWFWNGLPNDTRRINGVFFSMEAEREGRPARDEAGVARTPIGPGEIFISSNMFDHDSHQFLGETHVQTKTWHHLAFVRIGKDIKVHVDFMDPARKPACCRAARKARARACSSQETLATFCRRHGHEHLGV